MTKASLGDKSDKSSAPFESVDPVVHSDNDKSAVPDRADGGRKHAPNDPPGKKGEEPPVG